MSENKNKTTPIINKSDAADKLTVKSGGTKYFITAKGNTVGDNRIKVGDTIALLGVAPIFEGTYLVEKITREFSDKGYKMSFEAVKLGSDVFVKTKEGKNIKKKKTSTTTNNNPNSQQKLSTKKNKKENFRLQIIE